MDKKGDYQNAVNSANEIIEVLNDVNIGINDLVNELFNLQEHRTAEYLKMYGSGYIDKVIETLERETIKTLEDEL
jgi:hypothetical protein